MSVYFIKGNRYTAAWFPTKKEATKAEFRKREEVKNPQLEIDLPIDMAFSDLAEKRLD